MHPAVAKAQKIARIAVENGWKGKIDSDVIENGTRTTELTATRNDEQILVYWIDEKLDHAIYSIMGKTFNLTCSKQVIQKIEGWPDIANLFKWFPKANRPNLVRTYRNLPFNFDDDNEEIMAKLFGAKLFWYGHETSKIHADVVLPPTKKSSKNYRIVDVGHRKLFHFVGAQAGFRSVLLDTLLKVG